MQTLEERIMKKINLDALIVLLLLGTAVWTQFDASALPILGALGLVPLFGSVLVTPRKAVKQSLRVYGE